MTHITTQNRQKPAQPLELWTAHRAASPVVATAIHEGHAVRPDLEALYALGADERLREEDPFTEWMIRDIPNRIVCHRSRFETDLNRSRDGAVYLRPEQAWGLEVWRETLADEITEASLAIHDGYYAMLETFLRGVERDHGRFVVLDVHSYNHRRGGADSPPSDPEGAPEVNIGTFSMDRHLWAPVVDAFMDTLRTFDYRGRALDVRENVAFQGKGEQTRFIHDRFPQTGCAIAVEFKKFFMDEWTGEPCPETLELLRRALASTVPVIEDILGASR